METVDDIIADIRQRATVACDQDADANVHHNAIGYMLIDIADRIERTWKSECEELRRRLKVAEEICKREISSRQKTNARCEMCMEDSSAGEDCPYQGEPCGCNSPTYGEYPAERECEPFVEILAAISEKGV